MGGGSQFELSTNGNWRQREREREREGKKLKSKGTVREFHMGWFSTTLLRLSVFAHSSI